ncbi:MAG: peptidylprolyl isomerase [Verrucomicrobia bacterium]|nr:peptidylprolyl isomerase [Verrucomicrobiota bacterium]
MKLLCAALLAGLLGVPGGFTPCAAAQAATGAVSKPADKITELFGDPVLAKGKDLEIKRSQFDTALMSIKANAAAQGRNIPPEYMSTLERQVLNDLIGMHLLLNKATATDKTLGRGQFEKSFQKFKAESNVTDAEYEERLALQLRAQGLNREQWEKQRVDQMTIGFTLERELKISVSDDEVKKFYDENPSRFEEPEMVRASHILLSTRDAGTGSDISEAKKQEKRKQMEDILKRARAGEDFAKLAKEFSEDPGSKDKGGEYTFPRGQMVPAFESAAFSLNPNQISDIITTQFGHHIIKLSEKLPAKKVEFAKVAEELKEGLKQQEIQKQLRDYVEKLKQEAGVEILDEKLKMPAVGP